MLFYKPVTSLIGPNAPVIIPAAACPPKDNLSDYEVELVIVIGKTCKDVKAADALDYVLAYSGSFAIVSHASDSAADSVLSFPFSSVQARTTCHSASINWRSRNGASRRALVSVLGAQILGKCKLI